MRVITFLFISFIFLSGNLFAQDKPITGEIILVRKAGMEVIDLNGDGKRDTVKLGIIDDQGDFSRFILTINDIDIRGQHSYNVDKFEIVDIDKRDSQKEVAVHTPNANGPDEYIIYKYDGSVIKQIGRTYSTTTFNSDGTIEVESYMPFWDREDTYVYDNETDELVWQEKEYYNIEVECKVLEKFTIFPKIGSRGTSGMLEKGQKIRIIKAIVKDDCNKTGDYSWALCDEFFYVTDDGREGWATMADMMGKIDLPLNP